MTSGISSSSAAAPEDSWASFEQVVDGKAAIVAELDTMTKVQLLREGGPFVQMRYANEKKADVVDAVYREMVGEYALGESVTYGMGRDSYQNAVRKLVEATDADKLAQYVKDRQDEIGRGAEVSSRRGGCNRVRHENKRRRNKQRGTLVRARHESGVAAGRGRGAAAGGAGKHPV